LANNELTGNIPIEISTLHRLSNLYAINYYITFTNCI